MSKLVDATWVDVDPAHVLIPVRFKMPPNLKGKLYTLSPAEAIYVIGADSPESEFSGVVQFGVDRLQSPKDIVGLSGERIDKHVDTGELGGRRATVVCGTINTSVPHAVVQADDGQVQDVAKHLSRDRFRDYFVSLGERSFRASYRIPEKEAATWEPVLQAILTTITWK